MAKSEVEIGIGIEILIENFLRTPTQYHPMTECKYCKDDIPSERKDRYTLTEKEYLDDKEKVQLVHFCSQGCEEMYLETSESNVRFSE